ncbi:CsgG/HfaB family protein [Novosphingobium capsulatum]|uniref:CsgG/HfaB family protein n=1 Tax=Novosphingobium capsulatum TaxID=13688 RepID=UPI002E10C97A|nr:CsgG/HfaB family protein [Novosphingobium capsulatum]WQD93705.1 CsgG/HfaB family protein [Novosphingobium capsulatum]
MKSLVGVTSTVLCMVFCGCTNSPRHANLAVDVTVAQKAEHSQPITRPDEATAVSDADRIVADLSCVPIDRKQPSETADVPKCTHVLGTLAIVDGDNPSGWTQFQLAPPQKLLKVLIQRSGCFNLVDRGSGLHAAQRERDIGASIDLSRGADGQNQIKAADYVLVAKVQAANANSGGNAIGAGLGGLMGGIRTRKMEANVVLTVTNVRTTETIAAEHGYAAKNSPSFGAGGFLGGGLVGGGYDNTDIGRIVTMAFIQAYAKLIDSVGGVTYIEKDEKPETRGFTLAAPTALRQAASVNGRVVRSLPAGAPVYPTGNKRGAYREVADDKDNVGWVLAPKISADIDQAWLSSADAPLLPWPPPRASAIGDFTSNFKLGGTLGDYNAQLRRILIPRGYTNLHYFAVPDGFGITTDVERLNDSGQPSNNRWNKNAPPPENFLDYLSKLMRGDTGHYRVFAFIISDKEPFPANDTVNHKDLARWKESGKPSLSRVAENHRAQPGTKIWMLVYEFVNSNSKSGELVAVNDGGFPLTVHANFLGLRQ